MTNNELVFSTEHKLYTALGCLEFGLQSLLAEAKLAKEAVADRESDVQFLVSRQMAHHILDFECAIAFVKEKAHLRRSQIND